ncbi:hypothetical protein AMATHDRAFT_2914 [Amanita thiersii Skay4041]|uniref:Uncharacterized protein n=1 Tax=Amanita thiersii Skay4041 TaxID=703135 RepID=A0A2A9NVA9_9AGAR|nr:hypothetical protein AMATHDRAFT_2914 [Amanita thiersii Skay4041]
MSDGDKEPFQAVLTSDNSLFVATTLATLLLAGSAYIWRANLNLPILVSEPRQRTSQESGTVHSESSVLRKKSFSTTNNDPASPSDAEKSKTSRSKERRRRGKDPFRDILKSGKKLKALSRINVSLADSDKPMGDVKTSPVPQVPESPQFQSSPNTSIASSSRSASVSSSRTRAIQMETCDFEQQQYLHEHGEPQVNHESPHLRATIPIPSGSAVSGTEKYPSSSDEFFQFSPHALESCLQESVHLSRQGMPRDSLTTQDHDPPTSNAKPNSKYTEVSIISNPSPLASSSDNITTPMVTPTQFQVPSPSLHMSSKPASSSRTQGPWDVSNSRPASTSNSKYHDTNGRPRSQELPSLPTLPPHISVSTSSSTIVGPRGSAGPSQSSSESQICHSPTSSSSMDDSTLPFTFPSLNTSPRPKANSNGVNGNGYGTAPSSTSVNGYHGSNGASRRIPTPRRTSTPSSGTNTPPPSLTTQTQLASLRGALEAARLREEKMKGDLERCLKELDILRWENASWRRREIELQNQVHYLVHQLQSYASVLTPVPVNGPSTSSSIASSGNTTSTSSPTKNGSSNASPAKNGYHIPLPPQQHSLPPSTVPLPPLQILPPPNQMMPPPGMFSPLSMMHAIPSPLYYPYISLSAGHPHHHHSHSLSHLPSQVQPHNHPFSPTHNQVSPNQGSLISAFPAISGNGNVVGNSNGPGLTASGTGSGSSSAPGSSVGSISPDLGGSLASTITAAMAERGTRKSRARNQVQMSGWIGFGAGEDGYEAGYGDDSADESSSEVNEALADAILKRPASIGFGKAKTKEQRPVTVNQQKDEQSASGSDTQAEFTFPSLSDLGNVNWGKRAENESSGNVSNAENGVMGSSPVEDTVPNVGSRATGSKSAVQANTARQAEIVAEFNIVSDSHSGIAKAPGG